MDVKLTLVEMVLISNGTLCVSSSVIKYILSFEHTTYIFRKQKTDRQKTQHGPCMTRNRYNNKYQYYCIISNKYQYYLAWDVAWRKNGQVLINPSPKQKNTTKTVKYFSVAKLFVDLAHAAIDVKVSYFLMSRS